MSTTNKSNQVKFWGVVLGLLLVIGLVAGGTYVLEAQGLISAGETGPGQMADGAPAEFEEGASMPARPEGDAEGMAFNSQALVGLLKVVLQIALVVVVIAGGQWLMAWLGKRRRRLAAR